MSQNVLLIVSAVITTEKNFDMDEIRLHYKVARLSVPLERLKECYGNAFQRKTAKNLLVQRLRQVDLARCLQCVHSQFGNPRNQLCNYSHKS